jgi:NADH dehydrogenase (ubiquinone) Fe-S protein 1
VQLTRSAVSIPGAARTDWKIIRAASEFLGAPLPYDDLEVLRDRLEEISPALRRYDTLEPQKLTGLSKVQLVDANKGAKATGQKLELPIKDFYQTDVISRRYVHDRALAPSSIIPPTSLCDTILICSSSPTMARCSASFFQTRDPSTNFAAPGEPDARISYG